MTKPAHRGVGSVTLERAQAALEGRTAGLQVIEIVVDVDHRDPEPTRGARVDRSKRSEAEAQVAWVESRLAGLQAGQDALPQGAIIETREERQRGGRPAELRHYSETGEDL